MAEMFDLALPKLSGDVVVVPVPTVGRHVRERGLDHTLLIAKGLARIRGWECRKMVRRVTSAVQVGASAEQRWSQAREAYELLGEVDKRRNYLVIDDVCTTGASLEGVCMVLKRGGIKNVSVAVLAKAGD
jgi:predicted amidophosphoribosyltransferase